MRQDERADEDMRSRAEESPMRPDDEETSRRADDTEAEPMPPRTADSAEYSLPDSDDESYPERTVDRPDDPMMTVDDEEPVADDGSGFTADTQAQPAGNGTDFERAELFRPEMVERFRVEWQEIQTRFVDDPRDAVQGADRLLGAVVEALTSTVNEHKHELEGQWQQDSGEDESRTEDLRLALRRYRSFVNQLLDA
jgi:hypothetical protein